MTQILKCNLSKSLNLLFKCLFCLEESTETLNIFLKHCQIMFLKISSLVIWCHLFIVVIICIIYAHERHITHSSCVICVLAHITGHSFISPQNINKLTVFLSHAGEFNYKSNQVSVIHIIGGNEETGHLSYWRPSLILKQTTCSHRLIRLHSMKSVLGSC